MAARTVILRAMIHREILRPYVDIAGRRVGPDAPCFIVAEIGLNHNGQLDMAHRLIDMAVEAGVDAVKVQHFHTEDFLVNRSLTYTYRSQNREVTESQFDMFKRCEFSFEELAELAAHCKEKGIVFHGTPTSRETLDELLRLDCPVIKNGSDFLGHLALIRDMATSRRPVVLSTGMATLTEVARAVETFIAAGGTELVVLHCVSVYPAAPQQVRLRNVVLLHNIFQCPTGLSDHSVGVELALGARALGAVWIEKHVTLDKSLAGPDHGFSADRDELTSLVRSIRKVEGALSSIGIGPSEDEIASRLQGRLSCIASRDLPKGKVVTRLDIAYSRPGDGFAPWELDCIVGRRLRRKVRHGHVFKMEDFV